ncbi:MAG: sigma-70 family RNA polymerase sigma factor [Alphaproteobacteria bacterium]|nr:sigma-70 family RNA polymerase sigma factor [Alphaproteobacteria bacterium]
MKARGPAGNLEESGAPAETADEERLLWQAFKAKGSAAARSKLFSMHVDFARSIARRLHRERSRGDIEIADLYQFGYAGLLEALDRFETERGSPFRPFAALRITGNILDAIPHLSEVLEQISWRRRVRRERLKSIAEGQKPGETPVERLSEIALGMALGFILEGTGLFSAGEGDAGGSAPAESAYDTLAWKEIVGRLQTELDGLPERERSILRLHYLEGVAFDQLAAALGLSKARISQLHRTSLLMLRKRMRERGHFRMIR